MSRPPREDEPSTCSLSIRVTPAEYRDLKTVARDNQARITDVIREAVNEYVEDYRERRVFCHTKPDRS